MNNHQFVRGSASREAEAIKATVRDTAATVQEINAKLTEDDCAPAAPPIAGAKETPPAKPDSGQAMSEETPPAQPSPPVERTATTERGASTVLPLPEQRTAPAPFTVPALPDYTHQLQVFVSTVIQNQGMMLRTLEQAVEVCNKQQGQIKALGRKLDIVERLASSSLLH